MLRLLKKITARDVRQFWRALDASLRSTSLSSSPKGAEAAQHFTHRPSVNSLLSCGQTGDILNLCLASPLVSKQNNFYELFYPLIAKEKSGNKCSAFLTGQRLP